MNDKLNLIETIAKQDKFSTFSRVLGSSGANAAFSGEGEFTVFAPTNDAFGKIPEARMNELLNEPNQVKLKALLSYHILPGKLMTGHMGAVSARKSVTGQNLTFIDSNGLKVNGAGIQARNIEATNGVVHQVDTVLTPPPIAAGAAASVSSAPLAATTPETVPTAIPAAAAIPTGTVL